MDFWIILALMFVLYIVPEILKRRRPKKYEYPEVPGPQPAPRQDRPQPTWTPKNRLRVAPKSAAPGATAPASQGKLAPDKTPDPL